LIEVDKLTSWRFGLTPDQMREVDRLAEADYGIAPIQLMEVAGLQTARVARQMLGPDLASRTVCIVAGKGNNGGDGLVAARRLSGWGARVQVTTSFAPEQTRGLAAQSLRALRLERVEVAAWAGRLPEADLCIDALLGFGATGAPHGTVGEMIEALGGTFRVLALDMPSGLDGKSGEVAGACTRAEVTVTLALPKTGLLTPAAEPYVGELQVADIGVPPGLLRRLGVDTTGLFDRGDITRVG
jgi:hydroxyethylthiazole kinase-like uncharacterized protein yjeF